MPAFSDLEPVLSPSHEAILRNAYNLFYANSAALLQEGLSILSAIRRGENETNLEQAFDQRALHDSEGFAMGQLSSIGIKLQPGGWYIAAAKGLWETRSEELMRLKAGEAKIAATKLHEEQLLSGGNFVRAADGSVVSKADPKAGLKQYYVDKDGRLTTIAQNTGGASVAGTVDATHGAAVDLITGTQVVAAKNALIPSTYESIGLKLDTHGELKGTQNLNINPTKFGEITFEITQDSMVNLWTNGIDQRDVSLNLKGGSSPLNAGNGYTSGKAGKTGESISLKLNAGTYTMRVQDQTNYTYMGLPIPSPSGFVATVGIDIKKYNSAKISGMISISESIEAMPVSMSVAAFDAKGVRVDFDPITNKPLTLDPAKPVSVVIHGRINSEKSDSIVELAQSLSLLGVQVITVDWSKEAHDNSSDAFGLEGANWTPAVGKWIAHQLQSIGFTGDKINFDGPSWGSYVAYFAAQEMGQVNSILALDSASNDLVMNNIKSSDIDFRDVTKMSWAIESSPIGSNARAASADYSFTIDSSFLNRVDVDMRAHNFATTAFSAIAKDAEIRGAGQILLDPRLLIAGKAPTFQTPLGESLTPTQDSYALLTLESKYFGSGWEGIISVDTYTVTDSQGQTWVKTLPKKIEFKDAQSNTRTELLQTLPDSIISSPRTQI